MHNPLAPASKPLLLILTLPLLVLLTACTGDSNGTSNTNAARVADEVTPTSTPTPNVTSTPVVAASATATQPAAIAPQATATSAPATTSSETAATSSIPAPPPASQPAAPAVSGTIEIVGAGVRCSSQNGVASAQLTFVVQTSGGNVRRAVVQVGGANVFDSGDVSANASTTLNQTVSLPQTAGAATLTLTADSTTGTSVTKAGSVTITGGVCSSRI